MVEDQAKALAFYTDVLGFTVKHNIPMGEHSWITLVSPEEPNGVELALEPNAYPAAAEFQAKLMGDNIPWTSFQVDDVEAEYRRLTAKGVKFTQGPTKAGEVTLACFDDTCGNLIQIIAL
jgi:predicted enzyme related to lactoylglutathione lyase